MDAVGNLDPKRVVLVTARQFVASRVEKQLLTQVFELLCHVPAGAEDCDESMGPETTTGTGSKSRTRKSDERNQGEKQIARRPAA